MAAKGFNQNQDPMQKLQEGFGKLSSEVSNLYSMFSHLKDAIGQLDRLATRVTFQMFAMAGMNNPIPYGIRDAIAKGGWNPKGNKNSGGSPGNPGSPGSPKKPGPGNSPSGPSGNLVPYDEQFLRRVSADLRRQAAASVSSPNPQHYVDKQLLEPIPFSGDNTPRTSPSSVKFQAGGDVPVLDSEQKKLLSQASLDAFRSNIMADIKDYRDILKKKLPSDKVNQSLINNLRKQLAAVANELPLSVVESLGVSISGIEKAIGSFGKNTSIKTRTSAYHSAQKNLFDNIKAGKLASEKEQFSLSDKELIPMFNSKSHVDIMKKSQKDLATKLGLSNRFLPTDYEAITTRSNVEGSSSVTERKSRYSFGKVYNEDPSFLGKPTRTLNKIHTGVLPSNVPKVAYHELFHTLMDHAKNPKVRERLSEKAWRFFDGNKTGSNLEERRAKQFSEIHSKDVSIWQAPGKYLANAFAFHLKGSEFGRTFGLTKTRSLASRLNIARKMFTNIDTDDEGRPIVKPGSIGAMSWHDNIQHKLGVPFLAGAAGITGLLKASSPDAMHTLIDTGSIAAAKVGRGFIPPAMKMAKGVNDFGNWFDRRSDTTKSTIGWGAAGTVGALGLVLVFAKLSRAAQQAAVALASIRAKAGALGGGPGMTTGKGALIGGTVGALLGTAFASGLSEDISKGLGLKSQASNDAIGLGLFAAMTAAGSLGGAGITKAFNKVATKVTTPKAGAWPSGMNPNVANVSKGTQVAKGLGSAARVAGPATAIASLAMYGIDHITDLISIFKGQRVQQNNLTTLPTLFTPLNVLNNAGKEKIEGPKAAELPIDHPDKRFAEENEDSGYAGRVRKETIKTGVDIAGGIYDRMTQNIPERLALKIRKQFLTDEEAAEQDKMPSIGSMVRNAIGIGERGVGLNPSFNPDKFEYTPGEKREAKEKLDKANEEGKKLQSELKASLDSVRVEPQFMGIEDVWKTAQLSMLVAPNEQEKIEQAIIGLGVTLEEIAKNTAQVRELEPILKP